MTTRLWLPGADREHEAPLDGGEMVGGPPRVVWHTTEGRAFPVSTYRRTTAWPHVTWQPLTGELWQHLPANVAARALENPAGGVQTNRQGLYCVQVEVIGYAEDAPLDEARDHLPGLLRLLEWFRQLGIRTRWPAGSPLPYPRSYGLGNGDRIVSLWRDEGGHFGHSQVPENHHGDPGPVNLAAWSTSPPHHKPTPHKPVRRPTPGVPQFPRQRGDDQVIRRGDRGSEVVAVQDRLRDRGWVRVPQTGKLFDADGVFGVDTELVVEAFQHEKGLRVDGRVGRDTWAALWTRPVTP